MRPKLLHKNLKTGAYGATISTPVGILGLALNEDKLASVAFLTDAKIESSYPYPAAFTAIQTELQQYFLDPQHVFCLKLHLNGTDFQKRVWQALQAIPSGQTVTYKQLAVKLNTSPRAIGNACRANPLPIIIPCHRVVAATHLGGYAGQIAGDLFNVKQWLLQHEGVSSLTHL